MRLQRLAKQKLTTGAGELAVRCLHEFVQPSAEGAGAQSAQGPERLCCALSSRRATLVRCLN